MKKSGLVLAAVAFALLFLACASGVASAKTIHVPSENYTTIQSAVSAASDGDTIIVAAGTYHENVRMGKSLTLQGEAGAVIDGSISAYTSAKKCTISGFTIRNGDISAWEEWIISNNRIYDHNGAGGAISPGEGSSVSNNIISDSTAGILTAYSNITIINNKISNCHDAAYGVGIGSSGSNNALIDNEVSNCGYGIYIVATDNKL